jgi:hypothetical protein
LVNNAGQNVQLAVRRDRRENKTKVETKTGDGLLVLLRENNGRFFSSIALLVNA